MAVRRAAGIILVGLILSGLLYALYELTSNEAHLNSDFGRYYEHEDPGPRTTTIVGRDDADDTLAESSAYVIGFSSIEAICAGGSEVSFDETNLTLRFEGPRPEDFTWGGGALGCMLGGAAAPPEVAERVIGEAAGAASWADLVMEWRPSPLGVSVLIHPSP